MTEAKSKPTSLWWPQGRPVIIQHTLASVTQPWPFLRYENARETVKKLCAPEISEKIKPVWGLDEEHELNSVWRDCGIERMWIAFGMFELLCYLIIH